MPVINTIKKLPGRWSGRRKAGIFQRIFKFPPPFGDPKLHAWILFYIICVLFVYDFVLLVT